MAAPTKKSESHAGGGYDDFDTAGGSAVGKSLDGLGGAVGAKSVHLERHFHLFEKGGGLGQNGKV